MTSPKPQQFEGQSDASDDLIAELARMMAGDAQGSEPKPAAPVAAEPVRPASGASIRIPGGDSAQPENAPRSRPSFDFGRAPVAAPVIVPKSLSQWQAPSSPVPQRAETRSEPALFTEPAPVAAATPAPSFGFRAPEQEQEQHAEPALAERQDDAWAEEPQPDTNADDGHDAIADLIAAELENVQFDDEPEFETEPASVAVEPTAVETVTAHVDPEPLNAEPSVRAEPYVAPAPAAVTPPPGQPAAHNAFLRAVDLQGREPQADNFAVSPVFGLGGRPQQASEPAPASSPFPSAPVAERPVAPQPPADEPNFGASMFAPRNAAASEPTMPRHQPIAPAMSAIAPNAKLDPLEEIESLIGDAVRVELDAPTGRAEPNFGTPEVRAAASPVAPQRTSIPLAGLEPRFGASQQASAREMTAEDAILAAAAASGAEVNRIDTRQELAEDRRAEKRNRKEKRAADKAAAAAATPASSGNFRRYVGPAVAGTLLLAAGFGLYWVLGMGGPSAPSGAAPVLTAEAGAVKETPAEPAPSTETPSGSVVFNEMSRSSSTQEPGAEQLVSRDQTDGQDVARVITPEAEAVANGNSDSGLANRKVRTVTVRPDGTIVSGEADALAGSEQLPVARPNVPAVPGATTEDASDLLQGAQALQTQTAPPAVTPPAAEPAAQPQLGTPDSSAPIPAPRPAFRGNSAAMVAPSQGQAQVVAASTAPASAPTDLMGGSQQQAAPVQVASAAPASVSSGNAAAYVQLSSQRSQPEAQAALDNLQRRFGGLFGSTSLEIRQADLGERGTFYRVLLPASSLQSAGEICANVKAGGGDCFIPGN